MTLGEFFKNLNEENEEIINYKPEDYDEYIKYFMAAKANLEKIIAKGGNVSHNNQDITNKIEEMKPLIKSYALKKKANQNTSLIIAKHNQLMNAIYEYNKLLAGHITSDGTVGTAIKSFGGNTNDKYSINTEK